MFENIDVDKIEKKVTKVKHGFLEMREEALRIVGRLSPGQSLRIAKEIYASEKYQVRMVAVFVLGYISPNSKGAFDFLRSKASLDESWQVQEILAQAFNEYCKRIGYEKALATIESWLSDRNPNVRRAVTEGLRIWNQKDYLKEHPEIALKLLSNLKADESEYVRRSVGNSIKDISKKEKELVRSELATWDRSDPKTAFTYSLASKKLVQV